MGIVQNLGAQLFGSMLGPLIMVKLAVAFNWHVAFYLAAIPGVMVAILVSVYVRDPRPEPPRVELVAPRAQTEILRALFRYNNVKVCLAISCFVVGAYFLELTFLPLYCVRNLGMSAERMSVIMSCAGAAGVISSALVPFLSDRVGRKPVVGAFALMGALTPVAALSIGDSYWLLLVLVFIGGMLPGTTPVFMATIPMETVLPGEAAAAAGLILAAGSVLGGFVGPALAGALADRYGLGVPLQISAAMAIAAAAASLWLRETVPARQHKSSPVAL